MGAERRRDPRIRCSIPCELRIAGQSVAGKVRNVSAGGLGLVAEAPQADQGDEVGVTLRAPGLGAIEVRALVWHVRNVKGAKGEKPARQFGLVLSDAAPEFAQLVARMAPKPAPAAAARPPEPPPAAPAQEAKPPPTPMPPPEPDPPAPQQWRIRIKQNGGSRTCRIVASGATAEAAKEAALAEVGPGWSVLEVAAI